MSEKSMRSVENLRVKMEDDISSIRRGIEVGLGSGTHVMLVFPDVRVETEFAIITY